MAEAYFPVGPGLGPEENFLSLDDILMSQEKLPGRAESNLPRLAFALGQGTGAGSGDSIPEGSKLEIPMWLAKGLHDSKRRLISVELPKIYKEAWRTVFRADANVVDLHKMGPYYYGFGSQLLNFDNPENPEIAQTILQVTWSGTVFLQSAANLSYVSSSSLLKPWQKHFQPDKSY
ncbi:DNA replication complex GINS protein PSF3 isoform X2 [Lagopus leucura]|uniref:DNA replication complex GINS protein PSF3 isoform X2 n=1 Tax=Lagopus leucura TaxID=30410 RepID=UPI001C686C2B|nr:DNA replication complex GINS protein PSF3 isoform X2 [Lagopus leucura]